MVIEIGTNQKPLCDVLLVANSNLRHHNEKFGNLHFMPCLQTQVSFKASLNYYMKFSS